MRTIENEMQYERALAKIRRMMTIPEDAITPEQVQQFEELADAVVAYETIHYPIPGAEE